MAVITTVLTSPAAGGGHLPMPLADVPIEAFDSSFAVNLRGVFVAMRHEIPAMVEGGGGATVTLSYNAGTEAVRGLAAYVATKHGVEGDRCRRGVAVLGRRRLHHRYHPGHRRRQLAGAPPFIIERRAS